MYIVLNMSYSKNDNNSLVRGPVGQQGQATVGHLMLGKDYCTDLHHNLCNHPG